MMGPLPLLELQYLNGSVAVASSGLKHQQYHPLLTPAVVEIAEPPIGFENHKYHRSGQLDSPTDAIEFVTQ
jgi:hypothetical protein